MRFSRGGPQTVSKSVEIRRIGSMRGIVMMEGRHGRAASLAGIL
jgi:hypothetical protein